MNARASKAIRREADSRADARRVRRGRQLSVQRGQGHGERHYQAMRANTRPTFQQRADDRAAQQIARIQMRTVFWRFLRGLRP